VLRGAVRNVRRGEPDDVQPGSWAGGLGPNASAPTFASMGAFGFCAQTAGCNPAT